MISFNEQQGYYSQIIGATGFLAAVLILFNSLHNEPLIIQAAIFFLFVSSFMLMIFGLLVVKIVKRKKQLLRAKQ